MKVTLDTLLTEWLTRMRPIKLESQSQPTYVSMVDFDLMKRQPQNTISFKLSHDQCWRGGLMVSAQYRGVGGRGIMRKDASCRLHLHFANGEACRMTITCNAGGPDLGDPIPISAEMYDATITGLKEQQRLTLLENAHRQKAEVSFHDLLQAVLNTLQDERLVRDRLSSDLYKRKLYDGPFTFIKETTLDEVLDRIFLYPSQYGLCGAPNPCHLYNLKHQIQTQPSPKSPFVEDFHDTFAFTNGLLNCKTNDFVSSAEYSNRYILPRQFFYMSRADAATMATPHFDAFLTSQFGDEMPIEVGRPTARQTFKYAIGSLLFRLQRSRGEIPIVYNLVIPDFLNSHQQRVLERILGGLCRPEGVQVRISRSARAKAFRFDLTVLLMESVDHTVDLLSPTSMNTIPFIFVTQTPSRPLPHVKLVDIFMQQDCSALCQDLSWIESEMAGIASQLVKAYHDGEQPQINR